MITKKWILPLSVTLNGLFAAFMLVTCNKNSSAETRPGKEKSFYAAHTSLLLQSRGIDVDTANRMILSYLNGIDYKVNTNEIKSWFLDADSLRDYLSNKNIRQMKVFLAHNMAYINSGKEGKRPAPNDNALTIVLTGIDSAYRIVLTKAEKAMDDAIPCPNSCPPGEAGNTLLTQ